MGILKWKYTVHHKVVHSQLHVSMNCEESKLMIRIIVCRGNAAILFIIYKDCRQCAINSIRSGVSARRRRILHMFVTRSIQVSSRS